MPRALSLLILALNSNHNYADRAEWNCDESCETFGLTQADFESRAGPHNESLAIIS
jgi:hypothetical protein